MRILIVGCKGMLGTDLMDRFDSQGTTVGVDREEMDITDLAQCRARFQDFRPELVINAAAITQVDYCESHEDEAFLVNATGVGNLALAASSVGSLLVHYSTDYVFNGTKREPYDEEDTPEPRSVYGKSKLRGEELVRANCPNHLILRTSWLFGLRGPNFVRTIIGAARSGQELRVVDDQRGSPSYSRDLAVQTSIMLAAGCRGTYHVTNSGCCTWYDLAVYAVQCAGMEEARVCPVTTLEFPRPAPRPANSVLANRRLQREGVELMRPWPEAVREYVTHLDAV